MKHVGKALGFKELLVALMNDLRPWNKVSGLSMADEPAFNIRIWKILLCDELPSLEFFIIIYSF